MTLIMIFETSDIFLRTIEIWVMIHTDDKFDADRARIR